MTHTPGPWIVGLGPSDTWTVLDDVPPRGAIAGHIQRAEDARLMATAPELLEALQLVYRESPDYMDDPVIWEVAERAIAKATGEQP